MRPPCRPPNRSDGTTAVATPEESGGHPPAAAGAGAGASARTPGHSDSGERSLGRPGSAGGDEPESPPRCRTKAAAPLDSLGVFQKRSIFSFHRRSSSGYFSFDSDSLPSSPLSPRPAMVDRATQTPSPSAQALQHAALHLAEAPRPHGNLYSPSSRRQRNAAGDMQAVAVGQELQRIGDDINRLFLLRRGHERHRRIVIHPNQLPHIHQEPVVLLCMGLLLLVIGRLILLQDSTNARSEA